VDVLHDAKTASKESFELLNSLGSPDRFTDSFSRFRWHTNWAAALLLDGKSPDAARKNLIAAAVYSKLEKAFSNCAHAHLLLDDANSLGLCDTCPA
jgi:hypothetical protein